jgi:hypothetical protein
MKLLLYAGCLYLIGIAVVLLIQPSLMFRENGTWKEFGIGRDPFHHTWMPFWLFAILWALLSYMIVLMVAAANLLPGVQTIDDITVQSDELLESLSPRMKKRVSASLEQEGYYMLDTESKGTPKYVYLGPTPPNLVYNGKADSTQ